MPDCRLQIANIKCQIVGAQPQRDGLAAGCAPLTGVLDYILRATATYRTVNQSARLFLS
jgi:hypothetical protein